MARNNAIWILPMDPRHNRPGVDDGAGRAIRDESYANFPRPAHRPSRTRRPYSFAPGQPPRRCAFIGPPYCQAVVSRQAGFFAPCAGLVRTGLDSNRRPDYLDGRPVAALIYKRRMHNINVFLWPNHGSADDAIRQEDAQGYQILHWNGAETTYWVVSDLNSAELLELGRALRGN
jgi:hypothetical protein